MDIDIRHSFAKEHLTLFADDHHLAFEFNTEQELYQAIDDINKVISILSEMGMLINPTKAKAILRIQGTKRCDLRKKLTRKVQNELRLVLGSGPQDYIPIVDKVEYLGAVIAYDNVFILKCSRYLMCTTMQVTMLRSNLQLFQVAVRTQINSCQESKIYHIGVSYVRMRLKRNGPSECTSGASIV
ncbi:unnamed protein product [Symbiodinium sp. CCMP2592]|nr:unnamed protein product [Symbiodinium sp. CCMP2592]